MEPGKIKRASYTQEAARTETNEWFTAQASIARAERPPPKQRL